MTKNIDKQSINNFRGLIKNEYLCFT